jgi:hypothetical protein
MYVCKRLSERRRGPLGDGRRRGLGSRSIDRRDMASAVCPNCKLLVVEVATNTALNLALGDSLAARDGATVINNSFAIPQISQHPERDKYSMVASRHSYCGRCRRSRVWDRKLARSSNERHRRQRNDADSQCSNIARWSETAWSGTGSGFSTLAAKPAWQTDNGLDADRRRCPGSRRSFDSRSSVRFVSR